MDVDRFHRDSSSRVTPDLGIWLQRERRGSVALADEKDVLADGLWVIQECQTQGAECLLLVSCKFEVHTKSYGVRPVQ